MGGGKKRLTRLEIQRALLAGESVEWRDASGSSSSLQLPEGVQRRLFSYLLSSEVRTPKDLPDNFVSGLASACEAEDAPSGTDQESAAASAQPRSWRLKSIRTEGFGGVNGNGPPFSLELDGESLLLQGPNGSGKSSLVGAVLWAMTGERPRDQSDVRPESRADVFDDQNRSVGSWPPVACYPDDPLNLLGDPTVRVVLTFIDSSGATAKLERVLEAGIVSEVRDPGLEIPDILIETGLLMPARMGHIRFEKGPTRLTDAVQTLTGLDELVEIGALVEGLCHRGREYLSTNAKEIKSERPLFDSALDEARRHLDATDVDVPSFEPRDTADAAGSMAQFGQQLTSRAAELTQVIADDLVSGLNLTSSRVQQDVAGAISGAREDVVNGLPTLRVWKELGSINDALNPEERSSLQVAVRYAEERLDEAIALSGKAEADNRFQLKAVGAHWHEAHKEGRISDCPLCDQSIANIPELALELEGLRRSGEAATRKLEDNLNAIGAELELAVPKSVIRFLSGVSTFCPRERLISEIMEQFVDRERYQLHLATFTKLVDESLAAAPPAELPIEQPQAAGTGTVEGVRRRIFAVRRLVALANWFADESPKWLSWWAAAAAVQADEGDSDTHSIDGKDCDHRGQESFAEHLDRLAAAIGEAQPYRFAAEALRRAWDSGKKVWSFQQELEKRERIAEKLAPLKSLTGLSESQAREAIDDLSGEIASILQRMHITERLTFRGAELKRKSGLVVRGSFAKDIRIDATLVANTSWLRAVLWAFLFALRKEAVQQEGHDSFPVLLLDDPQATFDAEHRARWAREIVSLQRSMESVQVILTTYEEAFLELIKVEGVAGREGVIAAAARDLGHIGVFEGASLERKWQETQGVNTPQAGRNYMSAVRVYVEGMLQLMLRGQSASVAAVGSGFVLGDSRNKLEELNKRGIAPWNKSEFDSLVGQLGKGLSPVKYMEMAHHAGGAHLTMAEAAEVETHWRKKLHPALDRAFKMAREHQILHGGLQALEAEEPTCTLPEGYQAKVSSYRLDVLGRAAALTGGRAADGRVELTLGAGAEKIVLGRHFAYRLAAATLEPVARKGDLLIVQELGEPTPRSLVVAKCGDRILARRYELSDNHSDVAVLTAQAVNPRQIAAPIVAKKATLALHKVVGVVFDSGTLASAAEGDEVCDCGGESAIHRMLTPAMGLVQIGGQSAEPVALDGQFLLIGQAVTATEALSTLVDAPVIAGDADGNRYFKRLRRADSDRVVLESLEISGDFPPVVLTLGTGASTDLRETWPVLGVLFERPKGI